MAVAVVKAVAADTCVAMHIPSHTLKRSFWVAIKFTEVIPFGNFLGNIELRHSTQKYALRQEGPRHLCVLKNVSTCKHSHI